MARKRPPKARISPAEAAEPEGLGSWMLRYLEALRVKHCSESTVETQGYSLHSFLVWCQERGLRRPAEITRPILQRYQRWLFYYRKPDGAPLTVRSQHIRLSGIRAWFRWLTRQNALLYNPASELDLPRLEKRLPKHVLTAEEVETILALPDLEDPLGIRDRAMLEVFYSTGIRRMELGRLQVFDLDQGRGTVTVRQGKGAKDRVVPIGERAVAWTQQYLEEVRPELAVEPDEGVLFLTHTGEAFTASRLSQLARDYVNRADLGKKGACHLFRHACATLMLEGGADIRYIQEMLGHAQLGTTQIYTQVAVQKLKEIHAATHPAGRVRGPDKRAHPVEGDGAVAREEDDAPSREGQPTGNDPGRC